jgi:hypothetical protein
MVYVVLEATEQTSCEGAGTRTSSSHHGQHKSNACREYKEHFAASRVRTNDVGAQLPCTSRPADNLNLITIFLLPPEQCGSIPPPNDSERPSVA